MFACYARYICVTGLVGAATAATIFGCVSAAVFCYIAVSLFLCTHRYASIFPICVMGLARWHLQNSFVVYIRPIVAIVQFYSNDSSMSSEEG